MKKFEKLFKKSKNEIKEKIIADQNCDCDLHRRWRATHAEHCLVYVTILCVNK